MLNTKGLLRYHRRQSERYPTKIVTKPNTARIGVLNPIPMFIATVMVDIEYKYWEIKERQRLALA